MIATGPNWELRCGDFREALADVVANALISDPPYSQRTHEGALNATTLERGVNEYGAWSESDVVAFVDFWASRTRDWMVVHTDDVLGPIFLREMAAAGRYVFPLLPVLQQQPRVCGDGPSQHGHYLAVSRPKQKRFLRWGSLPGWYEARRDGSNVRGGKPLDLMRAIVRDYSRPGDVVCDPCAGGGTSLLAAVMEGRRAIGSEMDPKHFSIARKRLERGYTPVMSFDAPAREPEQISLLDRPNGVDGPTT